MDALVTRLRRIINDPASLTQVFEDTDLAEMLSLHRTDVNRLGLDVVTATLFAAPYGDWSSEIAFEDGSGGALMPDTEDPVSGRWTFISEPSAVYLTGASYDVHAAAADALTEWATRVALEFDFTADGATYHLSQKREALLAAATVQRAKMRAAVGYFVRADLT